jgi:hypothetical protein
VTMVRTMEEGMANDGRTKYPREPKTQADSRSHVPLSVARSRPTAMADSSLPSYTQFLRICGVFQKIVHPFVKGCTVFHKNWLFLC